MTSLLAMSGKWGPSNLAAYTSKARHPAGTASSATLPISMSSFINQYPVIQTNGGVTTSLSANGSYNGAVLIQSLNVVVACDWGNNRVCSIPYPGGASTTTIVSLTNPTGIVYSSSANMLYVTSPSTSTVYQITYPGGVMTTLYTGTLGGAMGSPYGITLSSDGTTLYVTDTYVNKLYKLTISTKTVSQYSFPGVSFSLPSAVQYISTVSVAVLDTRNQRIVYIDPRYLSGGAASIFNVSGATTNDLFGVSLRANGDLLVTMYDSNLIRNIGTQTNNTFNVATLPLSFQSPFGITGEDANGNFVVTCYTGTIVKIT